MGFTPLEGLVMATRSGSVDPGVLLWVFRHTGLTVDDIENALERDSGIAGLSGVSADLRRVLEAADQGDSQAQLAFGVYVHRLRAGIAAMAAAMDGLDGVVFTGGAGEGSARLRREACAGLSFLRLQLDHHSNEVLTVDGQDHVVSPEGVQPAVLVVHAREDIEIAAQVRALLRHT
jgi:acetate kinase